MEENIFKNTNINGKFVAFWGSCFSNWYPCEFTADNHVWLNSEQYFMYLKAKLFNDEKTAEEIKKSKTPKDAKRLGRKVVGFSDKKWAENREEAMMKALRCKFFQNDKMKRAILDNRIKNLSFVEGSPYDNIWGVGIEYNDPDVFDTKKWKGLNLLGKCLDRVRSEILVSC